MNALSVSLKNVTVRAAAGMAATDKKEEPGPDLIVDSVEASNPNPQPGETVWFDVTVKNQGDAKAAAFNVRISSDDLDQEKRVAGLAAGASQKLRHMGPLHTDSFHDLYWVTATADADDEVQETREDNNYMMISVMPQQQPPPPPPPPPMPPLPPHRAGR